MKLKKVFVLGPDENWIIDRFVNEWTADNADITVQNLRNAEVIWILAEFCWNRIPTSFLATKKILTTIHHLVPDKFGAKEEQEFRLRDQFTTAYHVPNKHTEEMVKCLTQKPITLIPYWAHAGIWHKTGDPVDLRKKHKLPSNEFLIGSFQRDTEGKGIPSGIFLPKEEKGPDLFVDAVIKYRDKCAHLFQVHVVLAGWRRQYVISRLEAANIPYTYFEKPSQEVINELYQCLNLYPVTSRYEGGPQSLIEAGLLGIPVISRDVGMASQLLPASAINDDVTLAIPYVPNVERLKLPNGYQPYRDLIESL